MKMKENLLAACAPLVACLALAAACFATGEDAAGAAPKPSGPVAPRSYYGKIARRMSAMLPRYHVLQQPLNDEISRRAWTNIVTFYDFDHSVFLQSDLDALAARETLLDDELESGDVSFGYDIYNLYCKRLRERVEFATNFLAKGEWDFSSNETYRVKRKDAPWPATREDAEAYWVKRLKNEILVQRIARELDEEEDAAKKSAAAAKDGEAAAQASEGAEQAPASGVQAQDVAGEIAADEIAGAAADDPGDIELSPEENLTKKYRQYYNVMSEPDEETVLQHYLSAVARAYDPHTDYMSPASKEDFDMEMNLSLCGIGAVLSMDDGALKIAEIMPGGPVATDGRIKEGDKIVGVRQGDGEMEDIMWRPIKKSIKKIRGPKGTRVTLEIIPRSDPTGVSRRFIELVRDEIKLEDQAATGRVETVTVNAAPRKLGYVYLPSFYGSMDKRPGEEGYRSCVDDVARYIAEFNAQDVEGLVLDLRGDGGGSLREAVMLSALFVPSGPVVQIRDTRIVSPLPIPRGNPVAFKRPVVVLTDRASASASEIVAGHLRDTGRAIVLGDGRTHGKGTVQTVLGMGPEKYGSMKITTARFYRIDGRSTQVEGVQADIRLPSLLASLDIGEDKLTYALPFSRIRRTEYQPCWNMDAYIPALAQLSEKRLAGDERYKRHLANVEAMRKIADREEVPLEYSARKAMMAKDREVRETEEGEDEDEEKKTLRRRRNSPRSGDVVLDEAFAILGDLVEQNAGATLPPVRADWINAILGI